MRAFSRFLFFGIAAWAFTSCGNQETAHPISLEEAQQGANRFVESLAEEDLATFRQVARPQSGGAVEESFVIEADCLDWATATISKVEQDFGPFLVWVTYEDEAGHLVRRTAESDGERVFIISFVDSCDGAVPPPGPGQPDPTNRPEPASS